MARPAVTSLAAIASVLAATSCCLPVVPFLAAAGLAGGSAFWSAARPYLLGLSVVLVALGFYQGIRAKRCNARRSVASRILLWLAAIFAAASVVFPQTLANAAADLVAASGAQPAGQPALVRLTARNAGDARDAFNAARDDVRLLLFLSPT